MRGIFWMVDAEDLKAESVGRKRKFCLALIVLWQQRVSSRCPAVGLEKRGAGEQFTL